MTIVAVIGDCTTTTSVAFAATWRSGDEVVVVEADPSGGSLSGWLDTPATPSLATAVTQLGREGSASWASISPFTQQSAAGVRFLPAPLRSVPASRAIDEAAHAVWPALARAEVVAIADLGRHRPGEPLPVAAAEASVIVCVHRLDAASSAAAAVRLERLVESIEVLSAAPAPVCLAVIGDEPFDPAEVIGFVDHSVPGAVDVTVRLAEDRLSAAVIAGRTGVSDKRLGRLPLLRRAGAAVGVLAELVATGAPARTEAW